MRNRADRLEMEAGVKQDEFNSHRGDIAYMTQPASLNSSFGKQRQRAFNRYEKGIQLNIEASDIRKKADWMEERGVVVKGDAEARRQEKRKEADKTITVGTRVTCSLYDKGTVKKVNKKTYTVEFDRGFSISIDKSWAELL